MTGNYTNISQERKLTNTARFILPLVTEMNNNKWLTNNNIEIHNGNLKSHPFINAFCYDLNNECDEPLKAIYLLYHFENIEEIPSFKQILDDKYTCSYSRYYNEKECIVYKYRIPVKYISDVELIQSGNFSKIEQVTKEKIKNFWNNEKSICDILNGIPSKATESSKLKWNKHLELSEFIYLDEALPEQNYQPKLNIHYEKMAA